ncbi:unnamed protein product [Victoria cruziana]
MEKQTLLLFGWLLFFAAPATVCGQGKNLLRPPALIVFGDSIADAGNNNGLNTFIRCDFPPYGRDFDGKMPTGRFSNGRIVNDILASFLGITDTLMAYRDPNLEDRDLLHGVTFASGGAGLDDLTSGLTNVISLSTQVELFKEYMARLRSVAGEEKARDIITNAQYSLIIGNNDIWNTYYTAGLRKNYDIDSYTSFLVDKLAEFTKTIYDLGVRKIGFTGLPPLGCVPFIRTIAGGPTRGCARPHNEASLMFNEKLQRRIQSLNGTLDGAFLLYFDIYTPLMELIQNPIKYGFEEATRGCCGTGTLEVVYLCNNFSPLTCADSSKYVFWDSFHPTERAYRLILNETLTPLLPLLQ